MGRVLRLRFDVPSIALESWMPGDDDRIKLPFDRDGLAGTISISPVSYTHLTLPTTPYV